MISPCTFITTAPDARKQKEENVKHSLFALLFMVLNGCVTTQPAPEIHVQVTVPSQSQDSMKETWERLGEIVAQPVKPVGGEKGLVVGLSGLNWRVYTHPTQEEGLLLLCPLKPEDECDRKGVGQDEACVEREHCEAVTYDTYGQGDDQTLLLFLSTERPDAFGQHWIYVQRPPGQLSLMCRRTETCSSPETCEDQERVCREIISHSMPSKIRPIHVFPKAPDNEL